MMLHQSLGRRIIISVELIGPGVNVNSYELAVVPCPKAGTYITLIDGLSAPDELFIAVMRLQHGHGLTPVQTRET